MGDRRPQPTWDAVPAPGSRAPGSSAPRRRILVENGDFGVGYAVERVLEEAGYEVAVCGGPDHLAHHECPLVFSDECALVAGADLVVHSLNPDRHENAEVLRALRAKHPDTPVVVEVAGPAAAHHEGLLAGCTVVAFPVTRDSLVEAVAGALPDA
jgi:CheY-like chemotaxis protein